MASDPTWEKSEPKHGILTIRAPTWRAFGDYIQTELNQEPGFVWRGQSDASWKLESSLDRRLRESRLPNQAEIRQRHLERFKLAVRGRRGQHPPELVHENDWWALGQHHGLSTPLLDWTYSPFVSAYFAMLPEGAGAERAVWGARPAAIEAKSREIAERHPDPERAPVVRFFQPMVDDNARLVNQGAVLSRGPDGVALEDWVRKHFSEDHGEIVLLRLLLPASQRDDSLRGLNRMNISHGSLFPDVYGAARFCNLHLSIDDY